MEIKYWIIVLSFQLLAGARPLPLCDPGYRVGVCHYVSRCHSYNRRLARFHRTKTRKYFPSSSGHFTPCLLSWRLLPLHNFCSVDWVNSSIKLLWCVNRLPVVGMLGVEYKADCFYFPWTFHICKPPYCMSWCRCNNRIEIVIYLALYIIPLIII